MRPQTRLQLAQHLRQHGAVSRADAARIGLSDNQLAFAVERGELHRPRRSLYVSPATRQDTLQQISEDVVSWQPRAYACRAAALFVHGVTVRAVPFKREILSPFMNGPERPEPPAVHRTRQLRDLDVTTITGIPVTTIERTVIDLGAELNEIDLISLLDHVIVRSLTSQAKMHNRATALRAGRRGVAGLARLTHPDAAKLFFSRLERLGAPLLQQAGLVAPTFNAIPIACPRAKRCDVVSEADRIVIEWDGLRFHSSPESRQADNDKGNALAGRYRLLRFTWRDVIGRPGYVVATVSATRR